MIAGAGRDRCPGANATGGATSEPERAIRTGESTRGLAIRTV
jgi:hypothetical protein